MSEESPQDEIEKSVDVDGQETVASDNADADEAETKEAVEKIQPVPTDVAILQGKVEILCKVPLPAYDNGPNKAYKAVSKDSNKTPLVAIVCERHLVSRRMGADVYKGILNNSMAKLVIHGAAYWPPSKKEHYIFVYLDNLGKPMQAVDGKAALGWKQDDVMPIIVKPMVDILQDMRDKDFVHGNIRMTNMYDGGAAGKPSKILLGDCLTCPPSYAQPALYETIERAMTDPIARGKGTPADDLYALGVTIAVAMRVHDPMKGLSPEEIIKQKMAVGSYAAVTGKDRFKGEILELLRGLLHDDAGQRWTIDEVLSWMDGRRLSPKQTSAVKKAPRPFPLGEGRYHTAPQLAMGLHDHPKELKRAVEDDSLKNWIERSLDDEDTAMRFEKALTDARQQSMGSNYESCLASNLSIALDPDAPLRFKGVKVLGDGIGNAMVESHSQKSSVGVYAEMFINTLVLNWLNVQSSMSVDVTGLFGKFERCRRYLKTSKFGEGIERVIYLLTPEAPCLSPLLSDYFVGDPEDLLRAYEGLCKKGKAPATFLDRHVVAFLHEKDQKLIEPYLYDLNTYENHRVIAANLKCLAAIQKRYKHDDVPAIAKVMAPRLQTVIKRYHDRRVQEKLRESVAEFQGTGDLVKVAAIFENTEVVKKDFKSFKKAMIEYQRIEEERQTLEMNLQNKDRFGVAMGKELSMVISCVLSVIIMCGVVFLFMSDNSGFSGF